MGRVVDIWRSWSPRRRFAVVAGAAVVAAAIAIAVYLALRRPEDVSNPGAAFSQHKQKTVKPVDWPLYGLNLERTRYLPAKDLNPPFRSSLWSFQAGKLLEFQPIVVKGRLYFLDKDALFYALSTDKGHVEWKRKIGSLSASSPAYADGRLFAVTLEPGQAVALDAKRKGKVLWRHPLPGRSESSPLVHAGKVILGSESGDIFALDEKTGKTRWTVHTGGPVKGALAYHNGTVFADNYAGEIYAIDAGSGNVKWQSGTQGGGFLRGGGVYSTPAVAFGRVYLGGLDGRIYSFTEKTGELAWSHSTGAEVYPSPAVADTPHSPPTVYAGSQDKRFYALDAKTGAVRWEHPMGGVVLGSSSVVGETVYVAVIGPNIGTFGYHVKTGKKVFYSDQGEYNPVISDGKKIYLTGTSTVRAFKPKPRGRHKHGHGANHRKGGSHHQHRPHHRKHAARHRRGAHHHHHHKRTARHHKRGAHRKHAAHHRNRGK
jgi:outer membrane protein assembly factor BamB